MDVEASLQADCDPAAIYAWVDDLSKYPAWLDIVPDAVPTQALPGDLGPAWFVTLRGRVGPLARSKRLRMVRTVHEPTRHARFERADDDGREHAAWVLDASVSQTPTGSRLTMGLHYGGTLWVPMLDRLLSSSIESSRQRLVDLIASAAD